MRDLEFKAEESGNYPNFKGFYTGTAKGRAYLYLNDWQGGITGKYVATNTWVDVVNGNIVKENESSLSDSVKKYLSDSYWSIAASF